MYFYVRASEKRSYNQPCVHGIKIDQKYSPVWKVLKKSALSELTLMERFPNQFNGADSTDAFGRTFGSLDLSYKALNTYISLYIAQCVLPGCII